MPWTTPTLAAHRTQNRDLIAAKLGLQVLPNGEVRVLADANAGNSHLNLQYLDWLALQLLPDTAEQQFLDKWANIYLVNADRSRGRKMATYAAGSVALTGLAGSVLPKGTQLVAGQRGFETTADVTLGSADTPVQVRALDAGSASNFQAGRALSIASAIAGITARATVVSLAGGTDEETDDELRVRVLDRIRLPPMGGDADDYVAWALSVAGVTRAWCSPNEMGIGTVTVRFMCDDLRATRDASTSGFPLAEDVAAVRAFLDTVRPVTVKDLFVVAPLPEPVDFTLSNIDGYDAGIRAAISSNVTAMLKRRAAPAFALNGVRQPAQTIYAAWVSDAVLATPGVNSFDLGMVDHAMPTNGSMAVLGTITAAL